MMIGKVIEKCWKIIIRDTTYTCHTCAFVGLLLKFGNTTSEL